MLMRSCGAMQAIALVLCPVSFSCVIDNEMYIFSWDRSHATFIIALVAKLAPPAMLVNLEMLAHLTKCFSSQ